METLWRTDWGRLAEVPLRRCSAVEASHHHTLSSSFQDRRTGPSTGPIHRLRRLTLREDVTQKYVIGNSPFIQDSAVVMS